MTSTPLYWGHESPGPGTSALADGRAEQAMQLSARVNAEVEQEDTCTLTHTLVLWSVMTSRQSWCWSVIHQIVSGIQCQWQRGRGQCVYVCVCEALKISDMHSNWFYRDLKSWYAAGPDLICYYTCQYDFECFLTSVTQTPKVHLISEMIIVT